MVNDFPNPSEMSPNPLTQFNVWYQERLKQDVKDPNSVCLSTVSKDCRPSSRIVLMKETDALGFIFYTNYESRKGKELEDKPNAALLFYWPELSRQVRVEGHIEKVDAQTSDEYFQTRPNESKLSAWASPQSRPIHNRNELEAGVIKLKDQYHNKPISRPPYWGGYRLKPDYYEFWMAHPYRLHHRVFYRLNKNNTWDIGLLAP